MINMFPIEHMVNSFRKLFFNSNSVVCMYFANNEDPGQRAPQAPFLSGSAVLAMIILPSINLFFSETIIKML